MIRELQAADLDEVMRIWLNANFQAHFFIDMMYWEKNKESVRKMISEAEVYVCDVNGSIQGFIGLQGNYVAGMFVKPEMQNRGVGCDLLNHVKDVKKKRKLELDVYQKNWAAVRFYISQGFDEVEITRDPNTGENQVRMEWNK